MNQKHFGNTIENCNETVTTAAMRYQKTRKKSKYNKGKGATNQQLYKTLQNNNNFSSTTATAATNLINKIPKAAINSIFVI